MARKLRVDYLGAIYHVMSRGDRRELIFQEDADRQRCIETLGVAGKGSVLEIGIKTFSEKPATPWRTFTRPPRKRASPAPSWMPP